MFRKNEGVDISYTKDFADFNHNNNYYIPEVNQFYVGWTEDNEWLNYTVDVKVAGTYKIDALYLPVYQLLGGKFRDKIRVYCDTALYQRNLPVPKDFADAALKAKGMGFNAMKFDLDQANDPNKYDAYNWTASPAELQRMYNQIAAAREAVGPNIDILVDMHGRYDAVTGHAVAKRLEPLNLLWLEEPVPAENVDAYKSIADSTTTPIAAGENQYLAYGFRRMLEIGAVDIVMPDLQKTGGLGEGQRIAILLTCIILHLRRTW